MERYSIFSLARHALSGHRRWPAAWRSPEPRSSYEVVIIGGGGNGLAAAYYLAKEHGVTDVAVLERGWLGGGNTGRNTTIVRSNYFLPENGALYEYSLRLWESLSTELNFNVMFSQRAVINLAHSDAQLEEYASRGNAMRVRGTDAVLLDRDELRERVPLLDCSPQARYPVVGGLMQPRAGNARHDALVWGFARGADTRGVDIIQDCEVTGIRVERNRARGVETSRGYIRAKKVAIAVAGDTTRVAAMAGLRLPIESHLLQAWVSEPVKPALDSVVTFGADEFYVSQTDKGEMVMGAALDGYNSYSRRGNLPALERGVAVCLTMFPSFGRLRLMRQWAGVVDMTMDGSPVIGTTPVERLYLNGGWCYGGFKAIPGSGRVFAYTIAHDKPHPLNEPFTLERFRTGRVLDEAGAGPVPGAH